MQSRRFRAAVLVMIFTLSCLTMLGVVEAYPMSNAAKLDLSAFRAPSVMTLTATGVILVAVLLVGIWLISKTTNPMIKRLERYAEEMKQCKEEWERTFDSMPDMVYIVDENHRITRMNKAAQNRFGSTDSDSISGRKCYETVHCLVGSPEQCVFAEIRADGTAKTFERYEPALDRHVEITVAPIVIEGKSVACVHVLRDISDRKRAEEALQRREEEFHDLYDNALDMYVSVDTDTARITKCNQTLQTVLGYSADEIIGHEIFEMYHPNCMPEVHEYFEQFAITGEIRDAELQLKRKDGSPLDVSLNALAARGTDGSIHHSRSVWRDMTNRKQAEKAVRESERKYRTLFDSSVSGIAFTNATGQVLAFNRAMTEVTGYTLDDLTHVNITDLFANPEDRKEFLEAIDHDGVVESFEVQLSNKWGQLFWANLCGRPITYEGEDALLTAVTDITERKQAEMFLRRSNRSLRMLSECNQALVKASKESELLNDICRIVVEVGGYRLAWIGFAEHDELKSVHPVAHMGYESEYLESLDITWADTERGRGPAGTAIRTGEPCCAKDILNEPGFAPWRDMAIEHGFASSIAVPLRGAQGSLGVLNIYSAEPDAFDAEEVSLLKELTNNLAYGLDALQTREERKRAEEDRRESEEKFRTLTVASPVGMFLDDADGNAIYINKKCAELIGIPMEQALNLDWVPAIHPDDRERVTTQWAKAVENGEEFHQEYRWVHADGRIVWTLGDIVPVRGVSSKVTVFIGSLTDITDRKLLEEQLRQQQKLESIGTLAGGVAHEINNPIMGIMNYAQLISDMLEADSPLREYSSEIIVETERITTIVRNLLTFARDEKQTHSPARMSDIIENTMSLIRTVLRHDQILLEVDIPEDLPSIKCRSQQIQQVMMNLLTNARDALNDKYPGYDENKLIRITAREIDRDGQRWIQTTVEDRGTGMSQETAQRMFDPFFTTKPRETGTGLGLSISHGIIQDHFGELRAESEEGVGSLFILELPVENGWNLTESDGSEEETANG